MPSKFSLEQIRQFWKGQAGEHGQSPCASWSDLPAIELEVREIGEHLVDGDRVLDVGCANGFSTVQYAALKKVAMRGLDFEPAMIEQARLRLQELASYLQGTVEFVVDDITALHEPDGIYDKVVATRIIINLGNWPRQLQGLRECARVLRPGGLLLLSDATLQGWNRLNAFRREWGLPAIPMPSFNQYLDEERVIEAVAPHLKLLELRNFMSTYFVGTRVIKPLLIQALGSDIDVADPGMEWNRWFSQWPAIGDYGTQKLFIFEKL